MSRYAWQPCEPDDNAMLVMGDITFDARIARLTEATRQRLSAGLSVTRKEGCLVCGGSVRVRGYCSNCYQRLLLNGQLKTTPHRKYHGEVCASCRRAPACWKGFCKPCGFKAWRQRRLARAAA